ncbi:uncharacterized protein DEA37_0011550 [Paragonimus westermani]|uniref:Uncharacterized protein n=1 Tax=Paragonimus westermani TaxID=34504 RepID=A0A5J4NNX0_9TREM|nr:uncharacterized protein DEA37_0011550 [Paragonimus westermani]
MKLTNVDWMSLVLPCGFFHGICVHGDVLFFSHLIKELRSFPPYLRISVRRCRNSLSSIEFSLGLALYHICMAGCEFLTVIEYQQYNTDFDLFFWVSELISPLFMVDVFRVTTHDFDLWFDFEIVQFSLRVNLYEIESV